MSSAVEINGINVSAIAEINGVAMGALGEINGVGALLPPAAPINMTALVVGEVQNLVMENKTDNWVTESKTDNIIEE